MCYLLFIERVQLFCCNFVFDSTHHPPRAHFRPPVVATSILLSKPRFKISTARSVANELTIALCVCGHNVRQWARLTAAQWHLERVHKEFRRFQTTRPPRLYCLNSAPLSISAHHRRDSHVRLASHRLCLAHKMLSDQLEPERKTNSGHFEAHGMCVCVCKRTLFC